MYKGRTVQSIALTPDRRLTLHLATQHDPVSVPQAGEQPMAQPRSTAAAAAAATPCGAWQVTAAPAAAARVPAVFTGVPAVATALHLHVPRGSSVALEAAAAGVQGLLSPARGPENAGATAADCDVPLGAGHLLQSSSAGIHAGLVVAAVGRLPGSHATSAPPAVDREQQQQQQQQPAAMPSNTARRGPDGECIVAFL